MFKYTKIALIINKLDKVGLHKLADHFENLWLKIAADPTEPKLKPLVMINDYYDEIGRQKILDGFGRNSLRDSFKQWCKRNNYNYDDMTKRPVLKYLFESQSWFKSLPAYTNKDRGFVMKPPRRNQPWQTINAPTDEQKKELFIENYLDTAKLISQQTNYKIPVSVILGIMAFESGWTSSNKSKTGNVFGLTGLDEEFKRNKARTEYEVMAQLPLFLTGKKRYHDAQIFELGRRYKQQLKRNRNISTQQKEQMVQQYIQKLKDAGYNSEPLPYVQNVMNIIRQNNFTQYD